MILFVRNCHNPPFTEPRQKKNTPLIAFFFPYTGLQQCYEVQRGVSDICIVDVYDWTRNNFCICEEGSVCIAYNGAAVMNKTMFLQFQGL